MSISPTESAAGGSIGTANLWATPRTTPDGDAMPGEDASAGTSELGFWDMLDVINPLQHLPVIGTIYRAISGDTISEAARMAGGALYGGPFGVVGALADLVVERETGSDIGANALAWMTDRPDAGGEANTVLADAGEAVPETAAQPINAQPINAQPINAQPINAAPVTVAAAYASPDAQAARDTARDATPGTAAVQPASTERQVSVEERAARATTIFQGRSADRLDAFIRQTSAVRRNDPPAGAHRNEAVATAAASPLPGAADATQLRAAALATPDAAASKPSAKPADKPGNKEVELALAGGDAGSVRQWMLRALDKYEHMRKQEQS